MVSHLITGFVSGGLVKFIAKVTEAHLNAINYCIDLIVLQVEV